MGQWEASAGASDEWYTPAYIFSALGETFDTDVAHPGDASFCKVPAVRWIMRDSLVQPWHGFIWMNPPFGGRNSLVPWMQRFLFHPGGGIALTPDRTSAPWFQGAWPHAAAVMFTPKVRFIRPDGSEGASPANGTCLWANGPRAEAALRRAARAGLGIVAKPV